MQEQVPGNGSGPLMNHLYRLANSYRDLICGEQMNIAIPLPGSTKKPIRALRKEDDQTKRISPNVASRNV